jgi:outer membrane protein
MIDKDKVWMKLFPAGAFHRRSHTPLAGMAVRGCAFVLALTLLAPGFAVGAGLNNARTQQGAHTQTPAPSSSESSRQSGATPGQRQQPPIAGTAAPVAKLPQELSAVAPDYQAPERALPSAERVGVDVSNQTSLSLNEAIKLALENNNDIEAASIDVRSAEFDLKGARGAYDPLLSSESYYESSTTPTSSILSGGANGAVKQKDATASARLSGYIPWQGGSYQVAFESSRSNTNNSFVSLNPQYPTSLTFTYTQPLLRNRGFDNNRRQIEVAKKNLSLTDAQFRAKVTDVIAQVQSAYWDLVYALRNLQVQIDAVKMARAQLESNKLQVEAGTLAPIDVVSAETKVTTYEQNVYTAQEAVTTAENTLKMLMLPDRKKELWSHALLPVTPVSLAAPLVPVEQAVEAALKNRPELAQLQANFEINEINTRYYRNQTKPQVDLVSSYGAAGLSGTAVENSSSPFSTGSSTVPENLIGGYGTSLSNLASLAYPTVRVGVKLSLPLRNRTAEANLGKSLAEGTRIKHQRDQQEQQIEAEVRNTLQAMRSAEARLNAAAASRSSATKQYESEQLKFQAGVSTVFLLLERQQELVTARGNELQAQTALNKAISAYEKATGSTLQVNNVTVRAER